MMDKNVPIADRYKIYKVMYEEFRNNDWDTVDESLGIDKVFDDVVREVDPWMFEEEEEEND